MHAARCYKTKTKWFCINVTAIVHVDGVVVIVVVVYVSTSRFIPLTSWVIVHLACCCPCLCINSSSNSSELLIVLSRPCSATAMAHAACSVRHFSGTVCLPEKCLTRLCGHSCCCYGSQWESKAWRQVVAGVKSHLVVHRAMTAAHSNCSTAVYVCVCVCVCALIGSLWTLRTRCLWLNADFTTNNIRPSTSVWYVCVCSRCVFVTKLSHLQRLFVAASLAYLLPTQWTAYIHVH